MTELRFRRARVDVRVRCSTRADGDFHLDRPGGQDRAVADGLVSDVDDAVLGIWVGDCAPVALVGVRGAIGAVHAGWRGLGAGVLATAVAAERGRQVLAVWRSAA